MHFETPKSLFCGQFRIGRVSSVDANRHSAQVQFFEQDGFVSWDLQVLRGFAADYCLPAQNTPVLCLLAEGRLGVGFVLGAIYTDSDAAPLSDASQRSVAGNDLRLGAPDAKDKVALSPKVKGELDKVKGELDNIAATLGSLTGQAAFGKTYTVGYSPTEPAAQNVSAK